MEKTDVGGREGGREGGTEGRRDGGRATYLESSPLLLPIHFHELSAEETLNVPGLGQALQDV